MKKFLYRLSLSMLLIFIPVAVFAQTPPAMTYKIGGTITIDDIPVTQGSFAGLSIEVTKDGNVALDPVAETTSLLPSDAYIVDIPVYDQYHTGAATPGETLEIHVYEGSTELTVALPYPAEITMGDGGTTNYTIDIVAYSPKTLTIESSVNGSTSPAVGSYTYSYNTVVPLTATPDASYVFSGWTGDVADTSDSTTTIIMDQDQTVSASFSQCINTLTMAVNNVGMGSVTPDIGDSDRACNSDVNITATPAAGYYFTGWTGDVENPSSDSTTVYMDGDKTVTANFAAVAHTLTIVSGGHGTTDPAPGDHEYGEDSIVTIKATPESGYIFSSWTGNVASTSSATTTVTMDGDKTVTANFAAAADDSGDSGGDGGGGGGGGIFGEISFRDLLGYHFDGKNSDGIRVYMPVTNAYKALKGAQTHVESFAPNIASFVRSGFDMLEQKAERNKDGFLYRVGTHTFPVLGKIAEYYLDIVGAERLKADAYADTTISIEEFKTLEQQGKAVAPHRVNFEKDTDKASDNK